MTSVQVTRGSDQIIERIGLLRQRLGERFCLADERHCILGREFGIVTAGSIDELLDELVEAGPDDPAYQDERLPYWAEVWPSAVALAEHVLRGQTVADGTRVIEIGCGLGLAGWAAMEKGASVLLTDYQEEALTFAELNGLINFGRSPQTALMDWRKPGLDEQFDVILAADVAYEKRFFAPLLRTFRRLLTPSGSILLAEPNRRIAEGFFELLRQNGLAAERTETSVALRGLSHRIAVYDIASDRADKEF